MTLLQTPSAIELLQGDTKRLPQASGDGGVSILLRQMPLCCRFPWKRTNQRSIGDGQQGGQDPAGCLRI
jgi:hypothetical protein